jgi:hypothetical protein
MSQQGGRTGGGGGSGISQQGGSTWARTLVGVVRPIAKAIDIPKMIVRSTVKRPVRIGFLFTNVRTVFVIIL